MFLPSVIHFVYAVPDYRLTLWQRGWRKLGLDIERWLPSPTPPWRHGVVSHWPRHAPDSITSHLYAYLCERCQVLLYDFRERIKPRVGPNDIIFGHPWSDPASIIQRLIMEGTHCRAKILIFPYHHGIPKYNEYVIPLVERCDLVLGITGQYWYDTMDSSPFASWKPKFHRLDMAIDASDFPFVKTAFNPAGKRKYLYIGSDLDCKGLDILSRTMERLPDFECGWFGPGQDRPHIHHRAKWAVFTPDFAWQIASKYDLYVHAAVSDANPTTILEAMAWGLPVACTPQSGYYNIPTIATLSTTDIDANVRTLLELQYAPEEHLFQISRANRRCVETDHTWERFCSSVWQVLQHYVIGS